MVREHKREIWGVILICLAVYAAYINTLPNIFMFDDLHMIVNNNYVKSFKFIPSFFKGEITSEFIARGMYRPLLMMTFVLDYFIGGLSPYGYHLVNILIHFLNAMLLYVLLRFFLKDVPFYVRLGLVLIFCVHPINTESVTYVSSRSTILAGFFMLLGVYSYIKWREGRARFCFLVPLLYVLALMTKEIGLVFPMLILAFEYVYGRDFKRKDYPSKLFLFFSFLSITFLYFVLLKVNFGSIFGLFSVSSLKPAVSRSLLSNVLTQSAVSFFYLYMFFFPFNLCLEHNFPVLQDFSSPLGGMSLLVVISAILSALFLRRRFKIISFSLLWYYICLLPQFYARLNIVAAEHHAYLAFFGVYFILGYLFLCFRGLKIARVFKNEETEKIILRYGFFFIFCLFLLLTVIRNLQWRNEYVFWKSTLRVNPESGLAKGVLATNLLKRGFVEKGFEYLKDSKDSAHLEQTRIVSMLNLIYYYTLKGEVRKAYEMISSNKEYLLKKHPLGYYKFLGTVYQAMGEKNKARQAWEKALEINPQDSNVKTFLGWWYVNNSSDFKKAEMYFRSLIDDNPDVYVAHYGLAESLEKQGLFYEAVEEYKIVIKAVPQAYESYYKIGMIYARRLLRKEAEWYLKKSIEYAPDFAPAYYNLSVFYLSLHEPDYEKAQEFFDKAKERGYAVDEKLEKMLRNRAVPME